MAIQLLLPFLNNTALSVFILSVRQTSDTSTASIARFMSLLAEEREESVDYGSISLGPMNSADANMAEMEVSDRTSAEAQVPSTTSTSAIMAST